MIYSENLCGNPNKFRGKVHSSFCSCIQKNVCEFMEFFSCFTTLYAPDRPDEIWYLSSHLKNKQCWTVPIQYWGLDRVIQFNTNAMLRKYWPDHSKFIFLSTHCNQTAEEEKKCGRCALETLHNCWWFLPSVKISFLYYHNILSQPLSLKKEWIYFLQMQTVMWCANNK